MKRLLLASAATLALFATSISSCKKEKDPEPTPEVKSNMNVKFDYVFGSNNEPWELGKTVVHPKTGDTLTFSTFKFYVSNIRLKKEDNTWWTQPESYYLVDASSADKSIMKITDIPAGTYTEMEYVMGVDSARNVSGAQTGALSLSNAMYWDWNSGYIMLKAEGNSPQSPTKTFAIHPGGFSGEYNIVTTKTTNFNGGKLVVAEGKNPVVTMTANPARLWHTAPSVKDRSTVHMPGAAAKQMAGDFYAAIAFKSIGE